MGFLALLASIGKWIVSKLSLKNIAILIVLVLLVYGGYKLYEGILQKGIAEGVASQQTTIKNLKDQVTQLTKERDEAKATAKQYKTNYDKFVQTSKDNEKALQDKYADLKKSMEKQLGSLQVQLTKAQELANHANRYIPAAADAACVVPVGFVQLFNVSLQDPAAGAGANDPFVAGAAASAYGNPSGIPLSTVARVIVSNNAAAVYNRNLVLKWQDWWKGVKKDYAAYQLAHPTAPVPPTASAK